MSDKDVKSSSQKMALPSGTEADSVANISMERAMISCSEVTFEPVNQLEQTSLQALICWASANCNIAESQVTKRLTQTFGAKSVAEIDRNNFDDAIAWLVDFTPVLN